MSAPSPLPTPTSPPIRRKPWRLHRSIVALAVGLSLSTGTAEVIEEVFSEDPLKRGWIPLGNSALAQWNPALERLDVTWDSSQPNSFFALPLGRQLSRQDDFEFAFDLELVEHRIGSTPGKTGTFQIAVGLVNLESVQNPGFVRGNGTGSNNLVEWSWFGADESISASISPAITSTNRPPRWAFRDSYIELRPGVRYRHRLQFTADTSTLKLSMTIQGEPGPTLESVVLPPSFTDFQVDAFAWNSYSDVGQDPRYAGSVFARGFLDNIRLTLPDPPIGSIQFVGSDSSRVVRFVSRKGWVYTLEASYDLSEWNAIGSGQAGTGAELELRDLRKALYPQHFFRVRCVRAVN